MTSQGNFDRVVEAWLAEAAPVSAPAGLHATAMGLASVRRQRFSWSVAVRDALTPRPAGALGLWIRVGAVTILTLLLGFALFAGTGHEPTPPPPPSPTPMASASPSLAASPAARSTERTTGFLRPFSYVSPASEPIRWERTTSRLFRFAEERFGVFHRGVVVAVIDTAMVHSCGASGTTGGRVEIRLTPAELLADLENRAGVALTEPSPATLDGRPALTTSRTQTSAACGYADIHVNGNGNEPAYFVLPGAAQTWVADVDGLTVLIDVWARTDAELEDWLPIGRQFVDSIQFVEQP